MIQSSACLIVFRYPASALSAQTSLRAAYCAGRTGNLTLNVYVRAVPPRPVEKSAIQFETAPAQVDFVDARFPWGSDTHSWSR